MTEFCKCGQIAVIDGKCPRCLKKPQKKVNQPRGHYSGFSKWRVEQGMFQASKGR